jgi:hypothetical protein
MSKASRRRRRSRRKGALPKGAYRLPTGQHVVVTHHTIKSKRYRVTGVHKAQPNVELLARTLLEMIESELDNDSDQAAV